jgi:hypothetical protein
MLIFPDAFDSAATMSTSLLPVIGAPVGSIGTSSQLIFSRDGGSAIVFAGISGTAASLNGPLPWQGSLGDAPVLQMLPAPPFSLFLTSLASPLGSAARSGLAYVQVLSSSGAFRGTFPAIGSSTFTMTVFCSGAQQWPSPVASLGFGVGTVVVDPISLHITVSLKLQSVVNETMAHIHIGSMFVAGAPAARFS